MLVKGVPWFHRWIMKTLTSIHLCWYVVLYMMTSSNGIIFRVTGHLCGKFPTQRPVTRSFDVFFDLRSNNRLSKQWRGWWFETQSCPWWRHRNDLWKLRVPFVVFPHVLSLSHMFYHCPTCFIIVDLTTKSHRRGTVIIEIANYNFYMKGIKTIYLHVYQDDIFACVCYSKSQPEHEILWLVTVNRSSGIAGRIFPYDSVFKLCFTIYTTRCVIKCNVDKSVFIKNRIIYTVNATRYNAILASSYTNRIIDIIIDCNHTLSSIGMD